MIVEYRRTLCNTRDKHTERTICKSYYNEIQLKNKTPVTATSPGLRFLLIFRFYIVLYCFFIDYFQILSKELKSLAD